MPQKQCVFKTKVETWSESWTQVHQVNPRRAIERQRHLTDKQWFAYTVGPSEEYRLLNLETRVLAGS